METVVESSDSEIPQNKFRRRRWYHRRDIRFLSLVGACMIVFYGYGFSTGPQKIASDLAAKIGQSNARVNVEVEARFPPEAFHISIFQDVGSLRGTKGNVTFLYRVLPKDIQVLSRKYWIKNIRLAAAVKR